MIISILILINRILVIKEVVESKEEPIYVEVYYQDGKIEKVELDDYLVGVVSSEVPYSFEDEAIKAQIVASRTFVLSRNLKVDNTVNSQVYTSIEKLKGRWKSEYEKKALRLYRLINETKGEVLTYDNQIISALFFNCSNGMTENCEDYFAGGKPYLRSVTSIYDKDTCDSMYRTKTITKEEFEKVIKEDFNCFNIISRKDSGRVDEVLINDSKYTGRQIREMFDLASSDFSLEIKDDMFIFNTVGSGHGVGMSQYGAQGMAKAGYNYKEILKHYYTGIEIIKI